MRRARIPREMQAVRRVGNTKKSAKSSGAKAQFKIMDFISGLKACLQQARLNTPDRNVSNLRDATLIDFEMEDVDDHVCSAVEEHDVTTDENMRAVGRRRGQSTLQFLGAGVHTPLKTWGKRAAAD